MIESPVTAPGIDFLGNECTCICHRQPGVSHVYACCVTPVGDAVPDGSNVAGRTMTISHTAFEHRCEHYISVYSAGVAPDNAVISLLCEAVRLSREACDNAAAQPSGDAQALLERMPVRHNYDKGRVIRVDGQLVGELRDYLARESALAQQLEAAQAENEALARANEKLGEMLIEAGSGTVTWTTGGDLSHPTR